MGYVHLGIDYGTSASKVLVRDYDAPGGERAYCLVRHGSFRIPSDLAIAGGRIYFGLGIGAQSVPQDAIWYRGVKMRVALAHGEKLDGSPPEAPPLPDGWTFDEIAVLSVCWLVQQAKAFAEIKTIHHRTPLKFGMTLGIPSDFRFARTLRNAFLAIAIAGWTLAKKLRARGDDLAMTDALHKDVQTALQIAACSTPDEGEVDLWLRSEARAAIWWAWQSPEFVAKPYVTVDVGAGTTNVAAFLIRETVFKNHRVKTGIAVLGASSGTVGMNALLEAAGSPPRNDLPPLQSVIEGRTGLRNGLERPYRCVFGKVYECTGRGGPAREQWRHARIIMLGGGSLSPDVCNVFRFDPRMESHRFEQFSHNKVPSDLVIEAGNPRRPGSARVSLSVAYGLSVPEDTLPSEMRPDQIEPIRPRDRAWTDQSLAGIYEK